MYGYRPGKTTIKNNVAYCVTFGIKGVTQNRMIGGWTQTFDSKGKISFLQSIPQGTTGVDLIFQSAEQDTCPDECISNLLHTTVQ